MKNFLTIGTFDGVHAGHAGLIDRLKKLARENKMRSAVLYFPLPPKTLLSAAPELTVLTLPEEKAALLKALGPDVTEPLNFKRDRFLSRENFFDLLLKTYNCGGILAGRDFAFGKDRAGHIDFLRKACAKAGVVWEVEDFFKTPGPDGHKISSSLIRQLLTDGEIEKANKFLGRGYGVSGVVVEGKKLGRRLGFPTANLDAGVYKVLPRGIFATEVSAGKNKFKGVTNIGFRPTVNPLHGNIPLIETHILDFNKNIYGRTITITFVSKIRGEKKFKDLAALKKQISSDAASARVLLRGIC